MKADSNTVAIVAIVCATIMLACLISQVGDYNRAQLDMQAGIAKAGCDQVGNAIMCRSVGGSNGR